MSGEILFLAHRIPFPADRGDKIRSSRILAALGALAPVHVGTFAENAVDLASERELAAHSASHCLVRRSKSLALAGLEALGSGHPVSIPAFASARLHRWVAKTLRERPISAIFVFSSQMAQYIPHDFPGRVVMDFVDVDSAKFEEYALTARQPLRTLYRREARLLAKWERDVHRRASVSLLVTVEEAALFSRRLDLAQVRDAKVAVMGNGIDADSFDPASVGRAHAIGADVGPHIVFVGQMDYPPNVAASVRFATSILPRIAADLRGARFHVVGRAPTAAVRALDGRDGCTVHGEVADVRPWLAAADLVIAPLTIARGIQNKVLEAMAMARPVLVSPQAATGIAGRDGIHFAVADSDDEFATRAIALLRSPEERTRMGQAARDFVIAHHGWTEALAQLPRLIGIPSSEARDAA